MRPSSFSNGDICYLNSGSLNPKDPLTVHPDMMLRVSDARQQDQKEVQGPDWIMCDLFFPQRQNKSIFAPATVGRL